MPELTLADAMHQALAWHQAGRLSEAEPVYRQVLAAVPSFSEGWQLLGTLLLQTDRATEAIAAFEEYRRLTTPQAGPLSNLADAYRQQGDLARAEEAARAAVARDPNLGAAWNNLGLILQEQGRDSEALDPFDRALSIDPRDAAALNNRGRSRNRLRQHTAAIEDLQQALQARPAFPEALVNLGMIYYQAGQYSTAIRYQEQAIALRPTYAEAHNNLGLVLLSQGRAAQAESHYRRALECAPRFAPAASNALLAALYRDDATLDRLSELHRAWDRQFAAPLRATWRPHANQPDPERPLRVGFVSADLSAHPIGYLLERVLPLLNREHFLVTCYSNSALRDEVTERLRSASIGWHDVLGLNDEQLADLIRADGIDLLIDLSGHTGGHRLLTFARKPAPVQMTWIGYASTTGLSAMDYIFTDPQMIPPESERKFVERIVRLPESNLCYQFPSDPPPVAPPPIRERGTITLGSFNNLTKLSDATLTAWGDILARIPDARLIVKFRGLNDPATAEDLRARFAAVGGMVERLELRGFTTFHAMLAEYADVDVALDPLAYNGGTTTMLALFMGVPVVTCPGETIASRQSLFILRAIGFGETITRDRQEYIDRVVALAGDSGQLAQWRQELRRRIVESPIGDAPRFVRSFERALRAVWRRWCGEQGASP